MVPVVVCTVGGDSCRLVAVHHRLQSVRTPMSAAGDPSLVGTVRCWPSSSYGSTPMGGLLDSKPQG